MTYKEAANIFRNFTPFWTDKQRHDNILAFHDIFLYTIPIIFLLFPVLSVRIPILLICYFITFMNLCNRGCFVTNFERQFKTYEKPKKDKKEVTGILNIIFSKFNWFLSPYEKVIAFTSFNLAFSIALTFVTISQILLNAFV